ncbi:RNA polymerase sigma-70 factor [Pseudoflavitalea rhizosphaerae]|uniref:RNA polymerase sigma-70 factor n=1 Tax=Pseudoflavitalea rhizosphaerae TaxID=1884793 RepID=UPI0013DF699F|nr:RNA polymerase sigma-70 factor [Pseudoflavitalea rhizosphaerae]
MQNESTDYSLLLEALKAFDLAAFDTLYRSTRERLFAYSFSILKDEVAAQDLVQDFFIDFWENKIFMNIHSGLVGYLVRSVGNRSIDLKKKEERRKLLQRQFGEIEAGNFQEGDKLVNRELGQELEAAITSLPPMPAKVFRLHYVEKQSYKEIAEELGISTATISNHMTRALKMLRQQLKIN